MKPEIRKLLAGESGVKKRIEQRKQYDRHIFKGMLRAINYEIHDSSTRARTWWPGLTP